MRKLAKAVLVLLSLYVVVMGGSGLLIRAMLSGGVGEGLRHKAEALLPVEVTIQGGDFDIEEWFHFRPAISFDRLSIANPPGYGDQPMLQADRVAARAKLAELFGGQVAIESIEIERPRLSVETAKNGKTNVQALLDALSKSSAEAPAEPAPETGFRVASFLLRNGEIRYAAPGSEPMVVRNLNLTLRDFDPAAAFPLSAELDLFDEEAIHLRFDGETGPFTPKSSPAKGKLILDARPGRLPQKFRRDYMGEFLASPGGGSRAHLETDVQGDLLGALVATGDLHVEDLQLGDPAVGQLPLSGQAPVLLTLIDPAANPTYDFVMPDATLRLGAGRWQGGLQVQFDGERVRGESQGAVSGVDINQMLSAFSDADDLLFGKLALKRYSVKFSGRDAAQMQRSLRGSGELEIADGKLALFDTLQTIEKKVMKVIGSQDSYVKGVTSFVRFSTDFEVGDGRLSTPNLMLRNDEAVLGGSGFLSYGGELIDLDYQISSLITGALAAALGGGKNAEGQAQVAAPLRVTGSTESPKVFLDLAAFVKQQAATHANRLLESLIRKKLPGLLPEAAPEAPAPATAEPTAPAPPVEEEKPRLPFNLGGILDGAIQKAKDRARDEVQQRLPDQTPKQE